MGSQPQEAEAREYSNKIVSETGKQNQLSRCTIPALGRWSSRSSWLRGEPEARVVIRETWFLSGCTDMEVRGQPLLVHPYSLV